MSLDHLDEKEKIATKEMVDKRVAEVWNLYRDKNLNKQIAELSPQERKVIDLVVSEFIVTESMRQKEAKPKGIHNDIILYTKPVGAKRSQDEDLSEAYLRRIMHRESSQERLQALDQAITSGLQNVFEVLRLPPADEIKDDITVQVLPVGPDNIVIRGVTSAKGTSYEPRGAAWSFNILAKTDSTLYKFLQAGSLGKLLPFIARNMATAINPEAAVFCDAGVRQGGRMDVVDFKKMEATYYAPSESLSGGAGYQQKFDDLGSLKNYVKNQGLGSNIQPAAGTGVQMFGQKFVNIKEGLKYPFSDSKPMLD